MDEGRATTAAVAAGAALLLVLVFTAVMGAQENPPSCGPLQTGTGVGVRALAYPAPSGGTQPADVSIPAGATTPGADPRPVIVVVHGGGWYFSDRHEMEPMAKLYAEHGYVVVNIDYSYADPKFPGEINDVSAAIRWAREQAPTWGGDPTRMVTMGSSAGANLALLAAVSASGGPVQATVGWSSPTDLNGVFGQVNGDVTRIAAGIGDAAIYLGLPVTPDKLAAASPIANIGPRAPPTFMVQSEGDFVPAAQQDSMATALRGRGVRAVTLIVPGSGHAQAFTDTATAPTLAFLDDVLGFTTPTPAPPPARAQLAGIPVQNTGGGGPGVLGLSTNQVANAAAIVGAGKGMGATETDIVVALATASQESRFLDYANDGTDPRLEPEQKDVVRSLALPHDAVGRDHGSVGQFQQQYPWWGSLEELMTPAIAAQKFFAKLLALPGRESMPVTVAAQTVQQSGAPSAYADDEGIARTLYAELKATPPIPPTVKVGDATAGAAGVPVCPPGVSGGAAGPIGVVANGVQVQLPAQAGVTGTLTFPNDATAKAAAAALSYLGTPYSWGGGGPGGPTVGIRDGGVADSFGDYQKVGFDCSGLTEYAYATAGIEVGGVTGAQWEGGQGGPHYAWADAVPGDLIFFGSPSHHVALYLGQVDGRQLMVEAPQSGDVVKVSTVRTGGDLVGVSRPTAKTNPAA